MNREIIYRGTPICYTLIYKKVKNINLRIKRNGCVVVSAARVVSVAQIDAFILSKGEFVLRAIEKCREQARLAQTEEEALWFLGRKLMLTVLCGSPVGVAVDGDQLLLTVTNPRDQERTKKLLAHWRDQQCRMVFDEMVAQTARAFERFGVAPPRRVGIRDMSTRWGSCQPRRGTITLNKRLLEAPVACIQYVVIHEFCHFIHPDHSPRFYALLSQLVPDWREYKKMLEMRSYKMTAN